MVCSLDLIPSPSPSAKTQIMGRKVCLSCNGKTLLGVVNKILKTKSLLTSPSNVLWYYLKQTFLPIIWIFTEVEGDGIESRLPFKIFSTSTFLELLISTGWKPNKISRENVRFWNIFPISNATSKMFLSNCVLAYAYAHVHEFLFLLPNWKRVDFA